MPYPSAWCTLAQALRKNLVREPDAGDPHVRFDERGRETEHGDVREAPATERAGQQLDAASTTAPVLDSTDVRGCSGGGWIDEAQGRRRLAAEEAAEDPVIPRQ